MDRDSLIQLMNSRGIKPTANRILVARALDQACYPVSLGDLEIAINTMDKSSIFRTLGKFVQNDLVHSIDDGSGSLKYELCHGQDSCTPADRHVHFYCETCHRTYCLEDTPIPPVNLPDGFHLHSSNYIIKGHCSHCSHH